MALLYPVEASLALAKPALVCSLRESWVALRLTGFLRVYFPLILSIAVKSFEELSTASCFGPFRVSRLGWSSIDSPIWLGEVNWLVKRLGFVKLFGLSKYIELTSLVFCLLYSHLFFNFIISLEKIITKAYTMINKMSNSTSAFTTHPIIYLSFGSSTTSKRGSNAKTSIRITSWKWWVIWSLLH